ncbi:ATP-dependent DNA helicase PcrA, partial [Streptomyces sp. SID10116]|nr:ATP-dependent DNA helicase PcrA [Streptomyces sp. SID10116]
EAMPAAGIASSLSSSRSRTGGAQGFATRRASEKPVVSLAVGDRVTHDQFGLGTVVGVKGTGANAEATVDFGEPKPKRLLLRYAPVEKL